MLARAKAAKADGVDLVIGLVETHGRPETQALLEGQEILPRRKCDYGGRVIEEFDIDGALARQPQLILVDEFAHTNAPDSRHQKRWQDVEELFDAGVDVWTTLNVQHLESLADVVARITGVAVRESVPDHTAGKYHADRPRPFARGPARPIADTIPDRRNHKANDGYRRPCRHAGGRWRGNDARASENAVDTRSLDWFCRWLLA